MTPFHLDNQYTIGFPLLPSATYRYANQIVTDDDLPETEGAGNMIFATGNSGAFVRSTESPRFLPGDLNTRHGEFTTGTDGSHTGWFVLEPTGNIRFTPGNTATMPCRSAASSRPRC